MAYAAVAATPVVMDVIGVNPVYHSTAKESFLREEGDKCCEVNPGVLAPFPSSLSPSSS